MPTHPIHPSDLRPTRAAKPASCTYTTGFHVLRRVLRSGLHPTPLVRPWANADADGSALSSARRPRTSSCARATAPSTTSRARLCAAPLPWCVALPCPAPPGPHPGVLVVYPLTHGSSTPASAVAGMTQVGKRWPESSYFLLSGKRSERVARRSEAARLAYGRGTKAPDCRYGVVQAASDRHDSCHTPQQSRK